MSDRMFVFKNLLFLVSLQILFLIGFFLLKIGYVAFQQGVSFQDFYESIVFVGPFQFSTARALMFCGSLLFLVWKTSKQIIEQERIFHG